MHPAVLKICCIILIIPCYVADFLGGTTKGDFSVLFREMGVCNRSWSGTNEIQINSRISRKSKTDVIISGNLTNTTPLDDSISMEVNFWRFHNERGFQKVPLTIPFNRACSDLRLYLGKTWDNFFQGESIKCPLPKGVHVMNDVNINMLVRNITFILPPQVMYGRYKAVFFFKCKRSGKTLGCAYNVLDFNAKW